MKNAFLLILAVAGSPFMLASAPNSEANAWPAAARAGSETEMRVPVLFTGGFETDAEDRGRPVILIASALKVKPEVFRDAFSRVQPAPAGQAPDPGQVQKNKATLLATLAPYGITNERLDEVSNFYRYNRTHGEMWRHSPATAVALVRHGVVTGFFITNPGCGYCSAPKISVSGLPGVSALATLSFGTDFKKNGSVSEIKLGN